MDRMYWRHLYRTGGNRVPFTPGGTG
jgi:hypothetical protein